MGSLSPGVSQSSVDQKVNHSKTLTTSYNEEMSSDSSVGLLNDQENLRNAAETEQILCPNDKEGHAKSPTSRSYKMPSALPTGQSSVSNETTSMPFTDTHITLPTGIANDATGSTITSFPRRHGSASPVPAIEDNDEVIMLSADDDKNVPVPVGSSALVPGSAAAPTLAQETSIVTGVQVSDAKTIRTESENLDTSFSTSAMGRTLVNQAGGDDAKSGQQTAQLVSLPSVFRDSLLSKPVVCSDLATSPKATGDCLLAVGPLPEFTCDICTKGFAAIGELSDHKRYFHLVDNISDEETPESISGSYLPTIGNYRYRYLILVR